MNQTPRSSRLHIALFGSRNAGKSSVINAITGQEAALVSPVKGTTTDPVYKAMELLPVGPVVFIDTAGLDDVGELGELRKRKTMEVLNKTDVGMILIDSCQGVTDYDRSIYQLMKKKAIPIVGVLNKTDIQPVDREYVKKLEDEFEVPFVAISALTGENIPALKKKLIQSIPEEDDKFKMMGNLIAPGEMAVLVTPIDKAAPKGRLILPQQQTIRDILEMDAIAIVTKEHELKETLDKLKQKPAVVITDSQAFLKVAADTPREVPLTSFSILLARSKGKLEELVRGAAAIETLRHDDTILVSEACTHHRQADDIGRVKIPRWLRQATAKKLNFEYTTGTQFQEDLSSYALIVHCGACMLNRRAMVYRIQQAMEAGVPIVNYGVLIAAVQGILPRAIEPFPLAAMAWEEALKKGS